FSSASASISSVMSRPYTFPFGPTRLAESSTSMPPPEPRSSTTSPSPSSASAVGLPQPRESRRALAGIPAVSPASYRSDEMGSQTSEVAPQQPDEPSSGPQQLIAIGAAVLAVSCALEGAELPTPSATFCARAP